MSDSKVDEVATNPLDDTWARRNDPFGRGHRLYTRLADHVFVEIEISAQHMGRNYVIIYGTELALRSKPFETVEEAKAMAAELIPVLRKIFT